MQISNFLAAVLRKKKDRGGWSVAAATTPTLTTDRRRGLDKPKIIGFANRGDHGGFHETMTELGELTPTQHFIRDFFTIANPCKGMMLYHAEGTGKTCTALHAAIHSFQKEEGFDVYWITDNNFKRKVWESQILQQLSSDGISGRVVLRSLSRSQFWRVIGEKGRSGSSSSSSSGVDPWQKTIFVFENAQDLYRQQQQHTKKASRREDEKHVAELHRCLMHSYEISGALSARILLLTSHPIQDDPMDMIHLLNLCKPRDQQLPCTLAEFKNEYLKSTGEFSFIGRRHFLDDIAGYVSFLDPNRPTAASRTFRSPQMYHVQVPILENGAALDFDKDYFHRYMQSGIFDLKREIREQIDRIDQDQNQDQDQDQDQDQEEMTEEEMTEGQQQVPLTASGTRRVSRALVASLDSLRNAIKNKNLFQLKALRNLKDMEDWDADAYRDFKSSPYFTIVYKAPAGSSSSVGSGNDDDGGGGGGEGIIGGRRKRVFYDIDLRKDVDKAKSLHRPLHILQIESKIRELDEQIVAQEEEFRANVAAFGVHVHKVQKLLLLRQEDHGNNDCAQLKEQLQEEKKKMGLYANNKTAFYHRNRTVRQNLGDLLNRRTALVNRQRRSRKVFETARARSNKAMEREIARVKSTLQDLHSELLLKLSPLQDVLKESFRLPHARLREGLKVVQDLF